MNRGSSGLGSKVERKPIVVDSAWVQLPAEAIQNFFDKCNVFWFDRGHGAMDKALAQGSNMDTTKIYSAPILLGISTMCTLSLTIPVITWSIVNTCHGEGKKRGIMVKY